MILAKKIIQLVACQIILDFKETHKMTAIDLSKQQVLTADPNAMQQINFAKNLERTGNTTKFFILEEVKQSIFGFSQKTLSVL